MASSSFSLLVLLFVLLLATVTHGAIDCSRCALVLQDAPGTYTIINNGDLRLPAGSIICWAAGRTYATGYRFMNFTGTGSNPFIFTNCNGTAIINTASHAINTLYSSYFRITGKYEDTDPTNYGLQITKSAKGIALEAGSTDFEVDHVEVSGCIDHAAIIAKTDPEVDGGAWQRPGFVLRNPLLHDNYIHDVDTEAYYIGYFDFEGSMAHTIVGLRVYGNIIRNTGWDGIQVGCAISDTKVYYNDVRFFGQANEQYQQAGLMLIGGFKGEVYGNKVMDGTGIGILYHGNGDTTIYNNVVVNGGIGGISMSINSARTDAGTFNAFHHNTIHGFGGNGLNIYNTIGQTSHAKNNVIIGTSTCSNLGGSLDTSNLCATSITADMKFNDPANGDYNLQANSSLIDQGVTCTPTAITVDYNGGARTNPPDIGAFEYGTTPRQDGSDGNGDGSDGNGDGGGNSSPANSIRATTFKEAAKLMMLF